jgi:iron-sulfur cluster assembly accessory protein
MTLAYILGSVVALEPRAEGKDKVRTEALQGGRHEGHPLHFGAAEHGPRSFWEVPLIQLTDQATKAVKEFIQSESKDGCGLRISVVGGGCSGFQYDLTLADRPSESDETFTFGDLRVFIDKTSMTYLNGTTVDFVNDLRGSGFTFHNPNAVSSCGCGHSFEA